MSLSYQQEHQLRDIEAGLRRADPHLDGMLVLFSCLYAGEGMPAMEQVPAVQDRSRHRHAAWMAAVLAAVAAAVTALLMAVTAPVWVFRARPPTSRPERARHGGEVGDRNDPPEAA